MWLGDKTIYPLVNVYTLLLKIAIEIVDFSINSMVIFHTYVNVYQRVTTMGIYLIYGNDI